MIKVAFILRSTIFTAKGGDTVQAVETARELGHLGIRAELRLTNEKIIYADYDLLHFFNITRPADILYHIRRTKVPFLVSPIFIDYSEYDRFHRNGLSATILRFLDADKIEYLKALSRQLSGTDIVRSTRFIFLGQRRTVREILKKAAMLLPNSLSEYNRLQKHYGISKEFSIVPNAVDEKLFEHGANVKKDEKLVLCVARIEGIKNQLNLIKAVKNTQFKLVLIGAPAPNQRSYYLQCKKIAGDNVQFIDHLTQPQLLNWYECANTHILPSWFETTGLSSLEAAAMGCNVIITDRGDATEYFGSLADYCDPGSPKSIRAALFNAEASKNNGPLRHRIKTLFTWKMAAAETADAYHKIVRQS